MSFLDNRGETVAYLSTKHRMKTEVTLTNLISESATGKLYSIGTIIYNITPGLRNKFMKKLSRCWKSIHVAPEDPLVFLAIHVAPVYFLQ
jgi:hypothetical protein